MRAAGQISLEIHHAQAKLAQLFLQQASLQGALDCFTALGWIALTGARVALVIRKLNWASAPLPTSPPVTLAPGRPSVILAPFGQRDSPNGGFG